MISIRKRNLLAPFILGGFALLNCVNSPSPVSDGSSSETVIGVIYHEDGSPASQTIVRLIPDDYNPLLGSDSGNLLTDTTSSGGMYSFETVDTGEYSLEASHPVQGTRVRHPGIHIIDTSTVSVNDTLKKPGTIVLISPEIDDTITGYVYAPGTTLMYKTGDTSGRITLDSVPAGLLPGIFYSPSAQKSIPILLAGKVSAISGSVLTVSSPWRHSRKLFLNTAPDGANSASDVLACPVLVRLSSQNFSFSEARGNGDDCRFTKEDGTRLPHEIERWDATNEIAEIWVTVDTVYANSSERFIRLYWGNADSLDNSDPLAVFDTAGHFAGVWHLNENPAAGAGSVKDRTALQNHGTAAATMTPASVVEGIAGSALHFTGRTDNVKVRRTVQDDFTIGFWMRADSSSLSGNYWWQGNGLVDADVGETELRDFGISFLNNRPVFGTCCIDTNLQADVMVNDAQWHHVAVTRERATGLKKIYVDGNEAGAHTATTLSLNGSEYMSFGKILSNSFAFKGALDEIRISSSVRPAAWIRLEYMNQKANDALVVFR
jgi:hypothetical protein